MKPTRRAFARGLASLVGASGCGRSATGRERRDIELFVWGVRVGERDGTVDLAEVHRRRHPEDRIRVGYEALGPDARETLRRRIAAGEPPDTFQVNVGRELKEWVLVNGHDRRESVLDPLVDVPEEIHRLRALIPAPMLEELCIRGDLYAVPSNVHRINNIYCNVALFERFGLPRPTSVESLLALGPALEGTGVALLVCGTKHPWTLAQLAFECLLVAEAGDAFYRSYFGGREVADDPRIHRALECTMRLLRYANPDHPQLTWLDAHRKFLRGEALTMVMGDWARGAIVASGARIPEDVEELAFPGTAESFVYTSDVFPLPRRTKNPAGALRLLATLASTAGQEAVNLAEGSLPARSDARCPDDPTARAKFERLRQGQLSLALSGLVPLGVAQEVYVGLADAIREDDLEPALMTLRSRYALLR